MWEKLEKVAAVAGTLAVVVGIMWYVFELENRVRKIEAQMQTFAIAPAVTSGGSAPVVNPLLQACADLSSKAASAIKDGSPFTVAQPIQEMMDKLGCNLKK